MLQDWLTSRTHEPEDYRWLVERVTTWPDARYATRLAEEYVERLWCSDPAARFRRTLYG
jgi:hypothetical protein